MRAFLLVTFGSLTLLNYCTRRDFRYPPFLASAVWLVTLLLYYYAPIEVFPIGASTAIIFIVTLMSFTAGGLITLFLFNSNSEMEAGKFERIDAPPLRPRVKKILLSLSVLLLPVMIAKAIWLAEQSGLDNFFIGLRIQTSLPDSPGYGFIGNAGALSYVATFLYFVEYSEEGHDRLPFYLSLFVSLIYAVLSTGRTPIFLVLAGLMGISWMRWRFSVKKLVAMGGVFFLFFGAFAFALGKGADSDAPWADNMMGIGESMTTYLIGGLPAFDSLVKKDAPLEYGKTTFNAGINLFHRFRGEPAVSPIQEEVGVPFQINVYTAIQPVYKDFGIAGVVSAFTLLGAMSTFFYVKAAGGDRLHIFCYAVSLFPLLLSAFSDQYFAPMISWMKFLLAGYLYFRWGKPQYAATT